MCKNYKLAISIDMDDAWTNPLKKEKSFLNESFENTLNEFKTKNYKSTLFLIGKDLDNHKIMIRRAGSMGFELGNHAFSHNYLNGMTEIEIMSEIQGTHDALKTYGAFGWF